MFDKITLRASVSSEECAHLAAVHRLAVWSNSEGTQVEYRSSNYSKFTGVELRIVKNIVTLKCSLHKYWSNLTTGQLRNDTLFTMSEALLAFESLLFENGLLPHKVRVVQFEVGINLHVSYDPITYIEQANYIAASNGETKEMFVDANFRKNRQRTSEKHKDVRRYFKIYDKGYEMSEKKRKPGDNPSLQECILRIETVYKRYSVRSDKFFTTENVKNISRRFYTDWKDLFFIREIRAQKGCKKSEKDRAKKLINSGPDEYLREIRRQHHEKKLTDKEYRTIREFIRDFEENEHKYKVIISPQEKEYKTLMPSIFHAANT